MLGRTYGDSFLELRRGGSAEATTGPPACQPAAPPSAPAYFRRRATSSRLRCLQLLDHLFELLLVVRRARGNGERDAVDHAGGAFRDLLHDLIVRADHGELLEHIVRD